MIVHGVFLQTMGGADPPAIPPPAPSPIPGGGGELPPLPPVGGLTQEVCQQANRDAYLALGGYTFGALVVGLVLFAVFHKKLVGGGNAQRIVLAAAVAALLGTALVWFDPARSDVWARCMNSAELAVYLTLGTQPLGRALALGFLPSFSLTALLSFVYSKVK
ncbi:MAG: hypothetical protein U0324_36890 [Polyangiales bacterium]